LAIEKLYVEEPNYNHCRNNAPENYIRSSGGFAFTHENIGGAYHKGEITQEHPEGSGQNR
jgi:hypothetical protein